MILIVKLIDDGPLDINFKAGDIVSCYGDAAPIGNLEKRAGKIAVHVNDPLNSSGGQFPASYLTMVRESLVQQEYEPGPTPDENRIRRERKHGLPFYRQKFSPEELAVIDAGTETLPDGPTSFGGTVAAGVISGLFTFTDIERK